MTELRDEFLSEEDLDLKNLTWDELLACWYEWLRQAQATNDLDAHTYSHGVFEYEPGWGPGADGAFPVCAAPRSVQAATGEHVKKDEDDG